MKLSQLSSMSAKAFVWLVAAGLTAKFFLISTLTSRTAMGFSKVAAGGDMLIDYLKEVGSLRTVKVVLTWQE